ncbi:MULTISPECIES: phage tail sheath subtilisin-like domain-containing protein [unclassified Duganella]|uniref:phage tail sheath subtilisin-like domain-containing protein n=1 Tax=unclassified Duganella TaxID=2636909 RepID=UPI000891338E|nr:MULTISPECIES: phage tail sheath subtilisin-like domain-containing protein [unclassified Duganella]SDH06071.1 Mu-like prophage tail sheath protein gpL [Duganella sp. OV458]SDK20027.1 Mu-like prophage tail sheath protein gpL [Duganella sp. OV510]
MSKIPFKQLPANVRVPLFYAEVDNSLANSGEFNQRALVIGQMLAAGVAQPNVPAICQSPADAAALGGAGSMLHLAVQAYRQNDTFGEVWCLPVQDAGGATAATGTVTFTAAATVAGTLSLYVAGVLVQMAVLPTQTVAQLATALVAAIAATPNLPVSAAAAAGVVTLTALNKGTVGNDIDVRLNYLGTRGSEATPTGLAVTIVPMANGTGVPALAAALANLGDTMFDFIVCPYTDAASLNAVGALLNDVNGRWSWASQLYGHAFAAQRGTVGSLTTFGVGRNDQHVSVMGFNDSPTPSWQWAAAVAGAAASSVRVDPAMPLQTVRVAGVLAPPLASRFQLTDRNTLLFDGISTFTVADDGAVAIENLITTYQKNAAGAPDNSYLQIETLFTLALVLRSLKGVITSKYARVKLAANGTRFGPGANVVTPNMIRADLIAAYRTLEDAGLVQNGDAFKDGLIVQKNTQNPNRVDILWPGTLINQLRIFALLAQFRLQ